MGDKFLLRQKVRKFFKEKKKIIIRIKDEKDYALLYIS
jgi:hypothetical protein